MSTAVGATHLPQRPKVTRERTDLEGFLLEPKWSGVRALVRIGLGDPRFVSYDGPIEGQAELFQAIVADARCRTATIDGVLVADFKDERDLEVDDQGNAFVRNAGPHQIFAAFDLLEVDGESLLDVPLLERKRHLEGLLAQSVNVRLTPYVTRSHRSWRDTLTEHGFQEVVLKRLNSTYRPGTISDDWIVVQKLGGTPR